MKRTNPKQEKEEKKIKIITTTREQLPCRFYLQTTNYFTSRKQNVWTHSGIVGPAIVVRWIRPNRTIIWENFMLGCFRLVGNSFFFPIVVRMCSRYTNSFKTFKIHCELSVDYSSVSCFLLGVLFSIQVAVVYMLFVSGAQLSSARLGSSRYSSYYLIFVRQNIKKVFRSPLAVHYNQHLQCRTMPIITVEVGCFVAVRVMSCKAHSQNAARKLIFYQVMHWLIVLVFLFWKNFHQHRRCYVSIGGRKQTV